MTRRMDETRFADIVAAYGADARRWPQAERAQALIFARAHAETADRLLAEARDIDDLLDRQAAPDLRSRQADAAAETRIMSALLPLQNRGNVVRLNTSAAAGRPRAQPWLWTGVGLAACVAGAALGAHLSLMSIGDLRAQTVLAQVQIIDGDTN